MSGRCEGRCEGRREGGGAWKRIVRSFLYNTDEACWNQRTSTHTRQWKSKQRWVDQENISIGKRSKVGLNLHQKESPLVQTNRESSGKTWRAVYIIIEISPTSSEKLCLFYCTAFIQALGMDPEFAGIPPFHLATGNANTFCSHWLWLHLLLRIRQGDIFALLLPVCHFYYEIHQW